MKPALRFSGERASFCSKIDRKFSKNLPEIESNTAPCVSRRILAAFFGRSRRLYCRRVALSPLSPVSVSGNTVIASKRNPLKNPPRALQNSPVCNPATLGSGSRRRSVCRAPGGSGLAFPAGGGAGISPAGSRRRGSLGAAADQEKEKPRSGKRSRADGLFT